MKEKTTTNATNTKIKCELCGKYFKSITNSHLRDKHQLTTHQYKTRFPSAQMISEEHNKKLAVWRESEENNAHLLHFGKEVWNSEKRINAVISAVKSEKYRKNHSEIMKEVVKNHRELFPMAHSPRRGKAHHHYGKSNHQRWYEKFGKEIADEKLLDWKKKNKIFSKSRLTSAEVKVHQILTECNINFIPQYAAFGKYYVDVFIPNLNLVLEVDGDFWHANPSKYSANDILNFPSRPRTAMEVWESDRVRQQEIESFGVVVKRIFQSEISKEKVISLLGIKI
jgi:very-short-patch-repair endonuclease